MSERASEGGLDESSTTDKVIEDASTKFFVGTEVYMCACAYVHVLNFHMCTMFVVIKHKI